jgi:hypothetical protein
MPYPQPRIDLEITIRWEREKIGGQWFVNEFWSGRGGFDRYGPMPESLVLPLIAERRAYWDDVQQRLPKMMQDAAFPQFAS